MRVETQKDFTKALLDAKTPAPKGAVDPKGRHAPKRFNVYRNNVIVSLIEAVRDGFPVVDRLVGKEFFDAMARVYVRQSPPSSPLMFLYGESFPEFIENFEAANPVPYLSDIARLEYARRLAYFAADADYTPLAHLQSLGDEALAALRLHFHPSLQITQSPYPIFDIFEKTMDRMDELSGEGGQSVLSYRVGYEVKSRLAPKGCVAFFSMIQGGKSIGEAIEKLIEEEGECDIPKLVGLAFSLSVQAK